MNNPPRTAVERVRKSAAPRAVMKPDELPPTPRPPPSERCIRITPMSETAMTAWTIRRKANMSDFREKDARRLASDRRARFQPRLLAVSGRGRLGDLGLELLHGQADRDAAVHIAPDPRAGDPH